MSSASAVAIGAETVPLGGMFVCRPEPLRFDTGEELGLKLMSDMHIGARNVDYALITEELEEAKKAGDRIYINGDVFDMILVQDRKRFRTDCPHPRISSRADLVTAAIEWGAEILAPYADLIDMIGTGNHEESVVRYHSIDPIKCLIYELDKVKKNKEHVIHYGGYSGFIDLRLRSKAERKAEGKANPQPNYSHRYQIYYHHGVGGNAPVTGGMIDFARTGWVDADVIWFGHRHRRLMTAIQSISCPLQGDELVIKDVRHIQTGAYFDTYKGQSQASFKKHGRITNYAADSRCPPLGKGGARIILSFQAMQEPMRVRVVQ